jgi:hypothetical protein
MKVKTAAQTLSSSVADALEFLMKSGHPQLSDAAGTIKFIRIIDRLFDILNSRSPFGKRFKKPLSLHDVDQWCSIIDTSIYYLAHLKTSEDIPLLNHRRKTFVLGLITAASSIKNLAISLLNNVVNPFKYVLTYKFSQDHLELLFACIRGKNGFNSNPDVRQFKSSLKRILLRNSIVTSSRNANCLTLEKVSSGSIFSLKWNKRSSPICLNDSQLLYTEKHDIMEQLSDAINNSNLSLYKQSILGYISGFIVRKMMKNLSCSVCSEALYTVHSTKHNSISHDHHYSKFFVPACLSLIASKNGGGLVFPSPSVTNIVMKAEKILKIFLTCGNLPKLKKENIINEIHRSIVQETFFTELHDHDLDHEPLTEDLHSTQLVKKIVEKYCKIRLYAYEKTFNKEMLHKGKTGFRQQSTKLLTFKGL